MKRKQAGRSVSLGEDRGCSEEETRREVCQLILGEDRRCSEEETGREVCQLILGEDRGAVRRKQAGRSVSLY